MSTDILDNLRPCKRTRLSSSPSSSQLIIPDSDDEQSYPPLIDGDAISNGKSLRVFQIDSGSQHHALKDGPDCNENCTPPHLAASNETPTNYKDVLDLTGNNQLGNRGELVETIPEDAIRHDFELAPDRTSQTHSDQCDGQSLTPLSSEGHFEDHNSVHELIGEELEISQYDIWSDYDQAELDAFDEIDAQHQQSCLLSSEATKAQESKLPSHDGAQEDFSSSPTFALPSETPAGPSNERASPTATNALQSRPLTKSVTQSSESSNPNLHDHPRCLPDNSSAAQDVFGSKKSCPPDPTRLNSALLKPRRTVSSVFQTGAGEPYPMDDIGEASAVAQFGISEFRSPFKNHNLLPTKKLSPLPGSQNCSVFGFQTARGNSVAPPSKESLKKALDLCTTNLSLSPKRHRQPPDSPSPSHRAKILKASQCPSGQLSGSHDDQDQCLMMYHTSHPLQTTCNKSKEPSSKPNNPLNTAAQSSCNASMMSGGFSTGAGTPISILPEAIERARALLEDSTAISALHPLPVVKPHLPLKDVSNLQSVAEGEPRLPASSAAKLTAVSASYQPDDTLSATSVPVSRTMGAPVTRRTSPSKAPASLMSTPVRPMRNEAPVSSLRKLSHEAVSSAAARQATPAPVRRISNRMHIGLTPQSSTWVAHDPKGPGPKPFVTPFKRPANVIQCSSKPTPHPSLKTPINSRDSPCPALPEECTPSRYPSKPTIAYMNTSRSVDRPKTVSVPKSVLEISSRSQVKVPIKSWLGSPKGYSARHLLSLAIPESIVFMTFKAAVVWNFNAMTEPFGAIQALGDLLGAGCTLTHTSPKWVANHWGLIIWKLAGTVRWQPDCLSRMWKPSYVAEQLKYRYEREIVCGHRPVVRRILDHECPASVPMCLVIVGIHRQTLPKVTAALNKEAAFGSDSSYLLELSDGWYRIKAIIDPVLDRVIKRGGLKVGHKLAISGAGSELPGAPKPANSSSNQTRPTQPADNSDELRLCLEGNYTARAIWHEHLGVRLRPWFASLRSLTHDGGRISMMDIVIMQIFPPMFISDDGQMGRWGEAEEKMLQAAWEVEREKEGEVVLKDQQREYERLEQVSQGISDIYSTRRSSVSATTREPDEQARRPPGFDAEDVCEELVEGEINLQAIKHLSIERLGQVQECITHKLEGFQRTAADQLRKSLDERVPMRRTRHIQLLRIKDFQSFRHGSEGRTAQLLVQDLSRVPDGLLKEGGRYWVQNLQPQRRLNWNAREEKVELSLGTRRDSKWRKVSLDD